MRSPDEVPRIFATAKLARERALELNRDRERADGVRAYAIELSTGDFFSVREPYWIIEFERDGVVVGHLCLDELVRLEP